MTEEGYDIGMKNEFLRMYDEVGYLIMKVQRSKNRIYKIKLTPRKPMCLVDDSWLWHARMGHTNFRMLEEMRQKQMVTGMPLISHPAQVCEGCMLAKQPRQAFPKEATWKAKEPL